MKASGTRPKQIRWVFCPDSTRLFVRRRRGYESLTIMIQRQCCGPPVYEKGESGINDRVKSVLRTVSRWIT
jgi:hypothetical protein